MTFHDKTRAWFGYFDEYYFLLMFVSNFSLLKHFLARVQIFLTRSLILLKFHVLIQYYLWRDCYLLLHTIGTRHTCDFFLWCDFSFSSVWGTQQMILLSILLNGILTTMRAFLDRAQWWLKVGITVCFCLRKTPWKFNKIETIALWKLEKS